MSPASIDLPDNVRLHSLNQVLNVLECLSRGTTPLGLSDLARRLGMSKGSLHRVLANLCHRDWVRRTDDGRYALGVAAWGVGTAAGEQTDLRGASSGVLARLTEASGETTVLAVLHRGEVTYVDKVDGPSPVKAYTLVGGHAPAHSVATGKALLAFAASDEILDLVKRGLEQHTPRTITDLAGLQTAMERIRLDGVAFNLGEYRSEVVGVAAPIFDRTGQAVAAVGVSGPAYRLEGNRLQNLAPLVLAAAQEISARSGYRASQDADN